MPAEDRSPEETMEDFHRAFTRLDLDGVMAHVADDATAFWPVQERPERLPDTAAIRDQFAVTFAATRAAGLTILAREVEEMRTQQCGDIAIVTFHLPDPPFGRRTFVLQWRWNRWLIVHIHGSTA